MVLDNNDNDNKWTFIFRSMLFLQHGLLLKDAAMGIVNFVGIALNVLYNLFFFYYSEPEERAQFISAGLKGFAVVSVIIGYVQIEDQEKVEFRFGMLITLLLIALIGAPLLSVVSYPYS